jgi:hypothetical protein
MPDNVEVVYADAINSYYIFDATCRKYMQMTGEEFLLYWHAGVWNNIDSLDAVPGLVDCWIALPFTIGDAFWEPAEKTRRQFIDEVICDRLDQWHSGLGVDIEVYEYLGWTREEYGHWVYTGEWPEGYLEESRIDVSI